MIKDALHYIADLGRKASEVESHIYKPGDGREFIAVNGRLDAGNKPEASCPIGFLTLTGLTDYIDNNVDGESERKALLINTPNTVELVSELMPPWNVRHRYAFASLHPLAFPYDEWLDHEDFLVMLQAQFVETEDRSTVLDFVGHVEYAEINTYADDGASQSITMKKGLKAGERTKIPNPVYLAPRRTFPEIEQPISPFIFRIDNKNSDKPRCKLVEADGGAWAIETIDRIKSWLKQALVEIDSNIPVLG